MFAFLENLLGKFGVSILSVAGVLVCLPTVLAGAQVTLPGECPTGPNVDVQNIMRHAGLLSGAGTEGHTTGGPVGEEKKRRIQSIQCTSQPMKQSAHRNLEGLPLLTPQAQIYPGNLLKGASYANGRFDPIAIKRAGGTMTLDGAVFHGKQQYRIEVDTVDQATVRNAIQKSLSSSASTSAADISFEMITAYSSQQVAFSFGLDLRFVSARIKNHLQVGTDDTSNYVVARFTQVYYSVAFKSPEDPFSVFSCRDHISPDAMQVNFSEDNPPLYVSNVDYGRQVFFAIKSQHSAKHIKEALSGAYNGGPGGVNVTGSAGLTYDKVLSESSITYSVFGGSQAAALAVLKQQSGSSTMFTSLRDYLSNAKLANYSADNPPRPIAYTLRYLSTNNQASMAFTSEYMRNDCKLEVQNPTQYVMKFNNIDSAVYVWISNKPADNYQVNNEPLHTISPPVVISEPAGQILLNEFLPATAGQDYYVKFQLGNGNCGPSSVNFQFLVDGKVQKQLKYAKSASYCGWQTNFTWKINPATGVLQELSGWVNDR